MTHLQGAIYSFFCTLTLRCYFNNNMLLLHL